MNQPHVRIRNAFAGPTHLKKTSTAKPKTWFVARRFEDNLDEVTIKSYISHIEWYLLTYREGKFYWHKNCISSSFKVMKYSRISRDNYLNSALVFMDFLMSL